MAIPKIIHCCWFGRGAFPKVVLRCIDSWKKYLPEYSIMYWNEDNFDINSVPYVKEAYEAKKWAFVSDYVRIYAMYKFGGIYMDTDMEVIKDFTSLLENKGFVTSFVEGGLVTGCFIAAEPKHSFVKAILDYYTDRHFLVDGIYDMKMNTLIYTKIAMLKYGLDTIKRDTFINEDIYILPLEYFSPYRKNILSKTFSKKNYIITSNTCTIHHDMGSWSLNNNKILFLIKGIVRRTLPFSIYNYMKKQKYMKELTEIHYNDSECSEQFK